MLSPARVSFAGERIEYQIPTIVFKNLLLDHLIVLPYVAYPFIRCINCGSRLMATQPYLANILLRQ
jgi:hypothetical protein